MNQRINVPLIALSLIVILGSQIPRISNSSCIALHVDSSICQLDASERSYVLGRKIWSNTWLEPISLTDSGTTNQWLIDRFRYATGSAEYRVLSGAIRATVENFSGALSSSQPKIRQKSDFFRGNALYWEGELFLTGTSRIGAWEWAVAAYSWAIAIDPKDEKAKTNQEYVRGRIQEASESEKKGEGEEKNETDETPPSESGDGSESESGSEHKKSNGGSGSENEPGTESSGSTTSSGTEAGNNQQWTWTNQGTFNSIGESKQTDEPLGDAARQEIESYAQTLQRYQSERDTYYNPSGKKDAGQAQSELYQMLKNQPLFRDMFQDEEPGKRNW